MTALFHEVKFSFYRGLNMTHTSYIGTEDHFAHVALETPFCLTKIFVLLKSDHKRTNLGQMKITIKDIKLWYSHKKL